MALHVSSIAQLKTLAKLKHKKERDKFPKLSDAQEALAQELRYRDWFHALQVLSQNQEPSDNKVPNRHLELVAAANKIVSVLNKKFAGRYSPARVGTPEDASEWLGRGVTD
jgi:hypothetical protein